MNMDLEPGTTLTYTVTVHREDGSFWAEVDELPGCFAAGDTEEELEESLIEAVSLYLTSDDVNISVAVTSKTPLDESRREELALAVCSA